MYVSFHDLKKVYDVVLIFNILTSKARAHYLDILSNRFPILPGVRQDKVAHYHQFCLICLLMIF